MQKNNQRGAIDPLVIILVILILAIGAFVGWRILEKNKDTEQPAETAQVTQESAQVDQKEPTQEDSVPEGWSTYTNEKYGFSISFPATYSQLEEDNKYATDALLRLNSYMDDQDGAILSVSVYKSSDFSQKNFGGGELKINESTGKFYNTQSEYPVKYYKNGSNSFAIWKIADAGITASSYYINDSSEYVIGITFGYDYRDISEDSQKKLSKQEPKIIDTFEFN